MRFLGSLLPFREFSRRSLSKLAEVVQLSVPHGIFPFTYLYRVSTCQGAVSRAGLDRLEFSPSHVKTAR